MKDLRAHSLLVEGTLPAGLSGQYLRLGPDPSSDTTTSAGRSRIVIEVVTIGAGQGVSLRSHEVPADVPALARSARSLPSPERRSDRGATAIIDFGGQFLVFGDAAPARALTRDMRSLRPVDLAGHGQPIAGHPTVDPSSGELHLLASPEEWSCAHQVISPGAMVRHTRALPDSPSPIHHLAATTNRLVLFAHGATGVTSRNRTQTERIQWFPTRTFAGREVVAVHDEDEAVSILVAGRGLERWTLRTSRNVVEREVIDAARLRLGCINGEYATKPVRYVFAADPEGGASTEGPKLHKHDLRTGRTTSCHLGSHRHLSDFAFARDAQRPALEDGGWLIGLAHDAASGEAIGVVVDAAHLEAGPVATIRAAGAIRDASCVLWSGS